MVYPKRNSLLPDHLLVRAKDSGDWTGSLLKKKQLLQQLNEKTDAVSFKNIRDDIERFITIPKRSIAGLRPILGILLNTYRLIRSTICVGGDYWHLPTIWTASRRIFP
jgi:hypothetical protein